MMFKESEYRLNNEDLQAGQIIGVPYVNNLGGFCGISFHFYRKAKIVKLTPKKTKVTVVWLDGEEEGKTEVLERTTIIDYVKEVEEYNQETQMRFEVCSFFLRNEGVCKYYIEVLNYEYDKKSSYSLIYDFAKYLRNSEIDFVEKLHTAITAFQDNLSQITDEQITDEVQ